ncbi:bifunctional enoyl-CoA hydratase/phosphate acetyltransferase [Lentibacillus cibarius]|uniref:Bifunctional enoyl-CoA hydratase/phosphate acetyltransferase n=1 Tax=Lentibacillus cibarius TaxID=2583219 RepID=A0A5S3QFV3_9BACI|nr:bifunctional enoyl-CoA hydratase/phosphate acetyltransferase [Lentibacillus cibarius]TMN20760.1 bifunctional enoyl-CoA hydratase/phosphate acetyltransferase [Lentibacillus cibarius]
MNTLSELKQQAIYTKDKVVAVAGAADEQVLAAVKQAVDETMCSFHLFGCASEIASIAEVISLDLTSESIAITHTEVPAAAAVKDVHNREADILMKGNIPTKNVLKAVLDKTNGLRGSKVLSHVALFEIPNQDRLIFLTDAAMNIAPGLEEKVEIIKNAVRVAHGVGISDPKTAVLAAVEEINPAMQATLDAAALTQMQKRAQISGCTIDGPLAFDNAVSAEAAAQKGIKSDVAGNADILVVPSIEAGNVLYKSFMYFSGAQAAAVISGATAPIVLTSRADSSASKLNSLAMALVSEKTFQGV